MANNFFTASTNPTAYSTAVSGELRTEFTSIEGAFDKLPNPYGGATKGFSSGLWKDGTFEDASITGAAITAESTVVDCSYFGLSDTSAFGSPTAAAGSNAGLFLYAVNTGAVKAGIGYGPATTHYLLFDQYSNVIFGDGANALATTATDTFMMIPTCAGTPSGTPTATYNSSVPLMYDSTNNKLYVYDGGWLGTAALT